MRDSIGSSLLVSLHDEDEALLSSHALLPPVQHPEALVQVGHAPDSPLEVVEDLFLHLYACKLVVHLRDGGKATAAAAAVVSCDREPRERRDWEAEKDREGRGGGDKVGESTRAEPITVDGGTYVPDGGGQLHAADCILQSLVCSGFLVCLLLFPPLMYSSFQFSKQLLLC